MNSECNVGIVDKVTLQKLFVCNCLARYLGSGYVGQNFFFLIYT